MNFKEICNEAGRSLIDLLYPPVCIICEKTVNKEKEETMPAEYVSGIQGFDMIHKECVRYLKPVAEPRCFKCGKHLDDNEEYCHDCKTGHHFFDRQIGAFEYDTLLKESLYRFKYKNKRSYADVLAFYMVRNYERLIQMWDPDVIIPVPMNKSKEQIRGYNQATLLAEKIGVFTGIKVDTDYLKRRSNTKPMKEMGHFERKENLKDVFATEENPGEKYNTVLLIDDIYTTGSTMDACARILKESGVKQVYGMTVCIGNGF